MSFTSIEKARFLFIQRGEVYLTELLTTIRNAKSEVIINIYHLGFDESGKRFINALKEISLRNVEVYILIDAIGSSLNLDLIISELKCENIKVEVFNEIKFKDFFNSNRRLHQKSIVIDWDIAFIGGINITDVSLNETESIPWLDYAIRLNGEVCKKIIKEISYYHRAYPEVKNIDMNELQEKVLIQDFWRTKVGLNREYKTHINNAKKSITLMNAYFFPGKSFLRQLRKAARRGVKVTLILNSNSDNPMIDWLTKSLYKYLISSGIQVLEWKKSILHSKIALIDDKWATIGSFNLDYLSRFSNIELNISTTDPDKVLVINKEIESIKLDCEKINLEQIKGLAFLYQLRGICCLGIYKIGFFFFKNFFINQKFKD